MARRALGPSALVVVQAVAASLAEEEPTTVLVACSGGADSLALAAGTAEVARRRDLGLAAVVVDHRLQEGSAQVAARAAAQLGTLGYADVVVRAVDVVAHGDGIEAAARAVRYAALDAEATAREASAEETPARDAPDTIAVGTGTVVLLGHTLDDQAETVLLGLVRGSGSRSLAGMSARTGRYRRPLLGLPRAATAQACHEWGLDPWQDPHNHDPRYTRVRIRHDVLPRLEQELGRGVVEALARTAAQARDDADLLDALALEAHPDADQLDCAVLIALPPALRTRVIRRWLLAEGSAEATSVHVRAVERLVTDWRGQKGVAVPGGSVARTDGHLRRDPHPS